MFILGDYMIFAKYKTHDQIIEILERKLRIAEMKREERNLKLQILKTHLPFYLTIKFNKLVVLLSIITIIFYTVAAILCCPSREHEFSSQHPYLVANDCLKNQSRGINTLFWIPQHG